MVVKIKKDWEHSLAPNFIFKRGSDVDLSAADVHSGVALGFICDPNNPEDVVSEPLVEKREKAISKKVKSKR